MAIFGDFLCPAFSVSRVQHVLDLHSKFALKATPCVEVSWRTSNLRPLRIGKEKRKKKPQGKNIMVCPIP